MEEDSRKKREKENTLVSKQWRTNSRCIAARLDKFDPVNSNS